MYFLQVIITLTCTLVRPAQYLKNLCVVFLALLCGVYMKIITAVIANSLHQPYKSARILPQSGRFS